MIRDTYAKFCGFAAPSRPINNEASLNEINKEQGCALKLFTLYIIDTAVSVLHMRPSKWLR